MKSALHITSVLFAILLSNCARTLGPDYIRPEFQPAANYKSTTSNYHGVSPSWWRTFQDPKLNSLQKQLTAQNLDLRAVYARREQAFAKLNIDEYRRFPAANADTSIQHVKDSQTGIRSSLLDEYSTQYSIGANLSYELDLWGRVSRIIESARADAAAADFTVEDVRVALQTQLARNYFALRFLDAEMGSLRQAVKSRKENLNITEDRFNAGIVTEIDTARAKSELAIAEAELLSIRGPRAQLENSIAVLLGTHPSSFSISSRENYNGYLPSIPAGIPAALLYRRPDVAVAERALAASTARIGVAEAERFPKISLTGTGGLSTISPSKLLNWSSKFYSLGPTVTTPFFQGRRLKANIRASKAEQKEALAKYQKTTLSAFADVESALASINALKAEYAARKRSVSATTNTFKLSNTRYKEGISSYLEVVDSQREQLNAQRTSIRARGQQFAATVQLIQALGGGFN